MHEVIRSMVPLPEGVGTKEGSEGPVEAYADGIWNNRLMARTRAGEGMVDGKVGWYPGLGYCYIPH
jgi:hypothetical protein